MNGRSEKLDKSEISTSREVVDTTQAATPKGFQISWLSKPKPRWLTLY